VRWTKRTISTTIISNSDDVAGTLRRAGGRLLRGAVHGMSEMEERLDPGGAPEVGDGWESDRLTAQRLRPGNEALLQMVFVLAGDYFLRLKGTRQPDPDAAERELAACAATRGRELALLTHRASGDPVGVLGWWRGNPEPDVALLGMLMMVPEQRGQGMGREAVRGLEEWLAGQGIRRLRTAVPALAYQEHKLLRALGFEQLPIRDHVLLGLAGSHLALFEKGIEGS
jgi:GNAT superfamily N-acetyltransferase